LTALTMPSSITWRLLLLAGLCCLVSGSLYTSSHDEQPPPLHSLGRKLSNFAFSLYRVLAAQSNTTNILFPALSIATTIVLISLGAKGDTHTQILQTLDFNCKDTFEIYIGLPHFVNRLHQPRQSLLMSTDNILVIDKNLKKVGTFLVDARELFHPEVLPNAQKTTGRKLVDLINDLDKNTALALVNYIFFHGGFYHQPELFQMGTSKNIHNFQVDENATITVPMVKRIGDFFLHWTFELSSFVLLQRYTGSLFTFLIVKHFQCSETPLFSNLRDSSANIHVLQLSLSGTYHLKTILGKLGITKVFSLEADLSGITEEVPLTVSKVSLSLCPWGRCVGAAAQALLVSQGPPPGQTPRPLCHLCAGPSLLGLDGPVFTKTGLGSGLSKHFGPLRPLTLGDPGESLSPSEPGTSAEMPFLQENCR
uniref:Serpin domain-containing protein n=1 Tax=Equus caballus TaxID=9796 RepID=A0A9L0RRV2_HORSE